MCVECWLRLSQGLSAITGKKFKRKIDPVTIRYQSTVAMSLDTKARVTVLENILEVPREGEQLFVCDRLDAVSAETAVVRNDLAEQRELVLNRVEELVAALDAQNQAVRET